MDIDSYATWRSVTEPDANRRADTATGGSKSNSVQLGEAANRGRFVVEDLEDGVQLRDL